MMNSLKELNLEQLAKVSGGEVNPEAYVALLEYVEQLKQKYHVETWQLDGVVTEEERKKIRKMYKAACGE